MWMTVGPPITRFVHQTRHLFSTTTTMSGIGPQLPPHLQHLLGSSNALEDDGDDVGPQPTVGPQMPPGFGAKDDQENDAPQNGIGPSIPAHLLQSSRKAADDDESTTPPPPTHRPRQGPEAGPSTNRRVVGPALPNYGPTYNPNTYGNVEDEDDSDEDVGPKPLPAGMKHEESNAVKEFLEREERMRKAREASTGYSLSSYSKAETATVIGCGEGEECTETRRMDVGPTFKL